MTGARIVRFSAPAHRTVRLAPSIFALLHCVALHRRESVDETLEALVADAAKGIGLATLARAALDAKGFSE